VRNDNEESEKRDVSDADKKADPPINKTRRIPTIKSIKPFS
jgi:hypothetical protein